MNILRRSFALSIAACSLTLLAIAQHSSQADKNAAKANQQTTPINTPAGKGHGADEGVRVVGNFQRPGMVVAKMSGFDEMSRRPTLELACLDGSLMILDVSNPARPKLTREVRVPTGLVGSIPEAQIGDLALFTESPEAAAHTGSRTISIVSFVDPKSPKTVRRFEKVTALHVDRSRRLVYVADGEVIWILRATSDVAEHFALATGGSAFVK